MLLVLVRCSHAARKCSGMSLHAVEAWTMGQAACAVAVSHWLPRRPVTLGLVAGAGELLQPGGMLFIYGPFKVDGRFTTDSNRQFHESLVASNREWGYRDVANITAAAEAAGLQLQECVPMPANNFALVYNKV